MSRALVLTVVPRTSPSLEPFYRFPAGAPRILWNAQSKLIYCDLHIRNLTNIFFFGLNSSKNCYIQLWNATRVRFQKAHDDSTGWKPSLRRGTHNTFLQSSSNFLGYKSSENVRMLRTNDWFNRKILTWTYPWWIYFLLQNLCKMLKCMMN